MEEKNNNTIPTELPTKNNRGRPTDYTEEMGKRICDAISLSTCGLNRLSKQHDWMPVKSTILLWKLKHPNFSDQYADAKRIQAHILGEECLDIADDTSQDSIVNENGKVVCNSEYVQRSRLRVDTRKWYLSKVLPKVYGDARLVEELEGKNDSLRKEMMVLRDELDAKNKKEY